MIAEDLEMSLQYYMLEITASTAAPIRIGEMIATLTMKMSETSGAVIICARSVGLTDTGTRNALNVDTKGHDDSLYE